MLSQSEALLFVDSLMLSFLNRIQRNWNVVLEILFCPGNHSEYSCWECADKIPTLARHGSENGLKRALATSPYRLTF